MSSNSGGVGCQGATVARCKEERRCSRGLIAKVGLTSLARRLLLIDFSSIDNFLWRSQMRVLPARFALRREQ